MTGPIRLPESEVSWGLLAAAIIRRMEERGLFWALRPGTVVTPAVDGTLRVQYDNDTVPVRVVSLVGPLPVDTRVMCVLSPPSGNHVIGFLGSLPPEPLGVVGHAFRDTASTAASGAQGVLRIDNAQVWPGRRYEIYTSSMLMFSSVANDVGTARLTFTTTGAAAGTGSTLLQIWNGPVIPSTANGVGCLVQRTYLPATSHLLSVLLFTQRLSGTGLISLFGSANQRTELTIEDKGVAKVPQGTAVVI